MPRHMLLVLVASTPWQTAASAQCYDYSQVVLLPDDGLEVPLEGVLVLEGYVDDPSSVTVTVSGPDGSEVAGALEERLLEPLPGFLCPELAHLLFVWRADGPLEPDVTYRAVLADGSRGEPREVEFHAASAPFEGPPPLPAFELSAIAAEMPLTFDHSCSDAGVETILSGCRYTDVGPGVEVAASVEAGSDRYVVYHVRSSDAEEVSREAGAWDHDEDEPGPAIVYRGTHAERCAWLEATSLIDGSTVASDEVCIPVTQQGIPVRPAPTPPNRIDGDGLNDDPPRTGGGDTGTSDPDPDDASAASCSAGGPGGGAWPLTLGALVLVSSRRRRGAAGGA